MRRRRDVLLCEHRRLFAEPLKFVLEARCRYEIEVVQDMASTTNALAARTIAVALVDRYLGPTDMLEHLSALARDFPTTKFVILDPDGGPDARRRALADGAAAWFTMTSSLETMVQTVSALLDGRPDTRTQGAPSRCDQSVFAQLTPREFEVLQCLVDGLNGRATAHELGVSYTTVRTHIQRVLWKLGVHSKIEAIAYALSHDLVPLSQARMAPSHRSGGTPA